jgi:hypothetical protein
LHLETMRDYVREFDGPEFDFLRPIITKARSIVERITGKAL